MRDTSNLLTASHALAWNPSKILKPPGNAARRDWTTKFESQLTRRLWLWIQPVGPCRASAVGSGYCKFFAWGAVGRNVTTSCNAVAGNVSSLLGASWEAGTLSTKNPGLGTGAGERTSTGRDGRTAVPLLRAKAVARPSRGPNVQRGVPLRQLKA